MSALDWETARRREQVKAAARQRTNTKPVIAWWWIISTYDRRCDACNAPMPKGTVVAYNHDQQLTLCETCVGARCLTPAPSKSLLAARAPKRAKAIKRAATRSQTSSAIAVECPACGAPPGQRCRQHGQPQKGSHPSRKKAAQATHLRP